MPDQTRDLEVILGQAFHSLSGQPLSSKGAIRVERFAHGGMSSGMVSPEFWRDEAVPLLLERYAGAA
jgi:hypothetical protein